MSLTEHHYEKLANYHKSPDHDEMGKVGYDFAHTPNNFRNRMISSTVCHTFATLQLYPSPLGDFWD